MCRRRQSPFRHIFTADKVLFPFSVKLQSPVQFANSFGHPADFKVYIRPSVLSGFNTSHRYASLHARSTDFDSLVGPRRIAAITDHNLHSLTINTIRNQEEPSRSGRVDIVIRWGPDFQSIADQSVLEENETRIGVLSMCSVSQVH
jgi:hypothetical protein